jgi:hypothetical protein
MIFTGSNIQKYSGGGPPGVKPVNHLLVGCVSMPPSVTIHKKSMFKFN